MPTLLHLLRGDSARLAGPVIEQSARDPAAQVTVVLLDGGAPPALPASVQVRRLGGDLDYNGLLNLIFDSDHVVSW
jgi:hypothetical protein